MDRYYFVGQKIELNNEEIFKKVLVEDDLKTNKKYDIKLVQINKITGEKIAKGDELSAEKYLNTDKTGIYKVSIYVKDGEIEAGTTYIIHILDTFLQNGRTRFISNKYVNTIVEKSKWYGRFSGRLKKSLEKKKGEGMYIVNISKDKMKKIKNKIENNDYRINQTMNRELAESW